MSRYKHLLTSITPTVEINQPSGPKKIIGLFPFDCLVDPKTTEVHKGKIDFLQSGIAGLEELSKKNYSVILFINQFKNRPLAFEQFDQMNRSIESFIKGTGIDVAGLYWCPGVDKRDPYVVPNPGMFVRVKENTNISFDGLPVISSSDNDLRAAEKVNAVPIKIGNGSNWTHYNTFYEWAIQAN